MTLIHSRTIISRSCWVMRLNGVTGRVCQVLARDYISDTLHSLSVGDSSTATNSGDDGTPWAIESYFGRLNYNLLDRYLLTATLRTDGSSSFGKNNRWGWFPSAALAWRITQEPFMKDVKWLKQLETPSWMGSCR